MEMGVPHMREDPLPAGPLMEFQLFYSHSLIIEGLMEIWKIINL